jgi:hypothetical protein
MPDQTRTDYLMGRILGRSIQIGDNAVRLARQDAQSIANNIANDIVEDALGDFQFDFAGQLEVVEPTILFDVSHEYDKQPLLIEETTAGAGNVATFDSNERLVKMTLGGSNTGSVTRQSRQYIRYQPGRTASALFTGVMGTATDNVTQRIGMFDDDNGMFFEQTSTEKRVVIRNSSSGATIDDPVGQSSWNVDKLDGTGTSGVTIDWTKNQVFIIDYLWLGTAAVAFGFILDAAPVWCHIEPQSNLNTTSFTQTGVLPVRYQIVNDTTAAAAEMKMICAAVKSKGGVENERALPFSAATGTAGRSIGGTLDPVIGIRHKDTFNSIVNRGITIPYGVNITTEDQGIRWAVLYDPTSVTGASWVSADADSHMEYDISATAISDGIEIISGFLLVGNGNNDIGNLSNVINSRLPLGLDAAGASGSGIALYVVAESFTGTATVRASMEWGELR